MTNRIAVESYPARRTSLGVLDIARALPARGRRLIGPWCFLDCYGPISFTDDKPMDVAPHPHIGLQTVSWLLDGEVLHRDTLGAEAVVRPGGVNVMTSGRGIAHSEETPSRNVGKLEGVQLWAAMPAEHRNVAPSFHPIESVPQLELRGGVVQLFMGELGDARSAAPVFSDIVGIDARVHAGESLSLPVRPEREHGVYLLGGDAGVYDRQLTREAIHYIGPGPAELEFRSSAGARLLVVGGIPFPERIVMWWNFVARSREEIAVARTAWDEGSFGEVHGYRGPRLEAPPLDRIAPPNPAS